jgi:hypothetical protein
MIYEVLLNKIRHIKWVEILACFCVVWWLYLLYGIGISRFSLPPEIVLSLKIDLYNVFIPALICYIIGVVINYSNTGNSCHTSFSRNILFVFILVFIDQMIKFLLFNRFENLIPVITSESYGSGYLEARILPPPILIIVKEWFFIQPLLHKGHMLQVYGIYLPWGLMILLAGIGLPFCYRYSRFIKADKRFLDRFIILGIAMTICYWADKLLYGGSIDYIRLVQFTVFDLKDMYGILGLAVLVQAHIHNRSWQMIKRGLPFKGTLAEFKEYINYEYMVIKEFFKKISHR